MDIKKITPQNITDVINILQGTAAQEIRDLINGVIEIELPRNEEVIKAVIRFRNSLSPAVIDRHEQGKALSALTELLIEIKDT